MKWRCLENDNVRLQLSVEVFPCQKPSLRLLCFDSGSAKPQDPGVVVPGDTGVLLRADVFSVPTLTVCSKSYCNVVTRGRGVQKTWCMVFSGLLCTYFRHYRISTNTLLPLALVHAWSVEVISSLDTKVCSWASGDSYVLALGENGYHLIPGKVTVLGLLPSIRLYPA